MTNGIQSDGKSKQMEFSPILNQDTSTNMNSQNFPKLLVSIFQPHLPVLAHIISFFFSKCGGIFLKIP